jgi:hypothetical protein
MPSEQHNRHARNLVASLSPPPHHLVSPMVRTPKDYSPFPLCRGALPCPRVAVRPSFDELPAAPVLGSLWTEGPCSPQRMDRIHAHFYIQKIIPYPIKPLEDCTEAPVFVVKPDLAPVFVFLNKI